MSAEDRIERARIVYERAVFSGDTSGLTDAERGLDVVEADAALARGRILHARFLDERAGAGPSPVEDPAELPLFERATELYRALGDVRGEAEGLFWIGCVHQVIRRDNAAAVPQLQRSRELAAQAGDKPTESEALRHLGIAAHMAGRLDEARERLEESSQLRREVAALPGVAANLVGLAYVAAAQDRRADALATLDEAYAIAQVHGAHAIVRQVEQARTEISDRTGMTDDTDVPPDVRLRAVEDSDLDVLFEHQADPGAAEMAAFPSRDRERFDAHWARNRLNDTAVLRTILADGAVAGSVNSWQDEGQRLVGYWIGREHWGRGVATQALTLLVGELPTRPLYAHVAAHNAGSIRVLQKCGFRRDRALEAQAPESEDGIEEFIFVLAE